MLLIKCIASLLLIQTLTACTSLPTPEEQDSGQLWAKFQHNKCQIEQRQQTYQNRGITQLEVSGSTPQNFLVTAQLDNANLYSTISILASKTRLKFSNHHYSESITVQFSKLPLRQALARILDPVGYEIDEPSINNNFLIINRKIPPVVETSGGQSQTQIPLKFIDPELAKTLIEGLYPGSTTTTETAKPDLRCSINTSNNTVFLSGTPDAVHIAVNTLIKADVNSGHIMIEMQVVEFNTEAFRQLGIRIASAGKNNFNDASIDFSSLSGSSITFNYLQDAMTIAQFAAAINLLISDHNALIIGKPYITTISNQEATLRISDDRYIRVQSGKGSNPNLDKVTSLVEMVVTPTVLVDRAIRLKLTVTEGKFIADDGSRLRSTENYAQSTVRVGDGETIIIGGLMIDNTSSTDSGLPGLRDTPAIGALFGDKTKANTRRQVMIYVTPYLVYPGVTTPSSEKTSEECSAH